MSSKSSLEKAKASLEELFPGDGPAKRIDYVIAALGQFRTEYRQHHFHILYGEAFLRGLCFESFGWDLRELVSAIEFSPRRFLLLGETGVGKEKIAQSIGASLSALHGRVSGGSFEARSAADFSENLLESELFGHKKGAFTGATNDRQGALKTIGEWGTLFLDEVTEASPQLQAKLLRVVQSSTFRRVGSDKDEKQSFHIIAASNWTHDDVRSGRGLRTDLYYRLSPVIEIPPLRERMGDQRHRGAILDCLVDSVYRERRGVGVKSAGSSEKVIGESDWLNTANQDTKESIRNTIAEGTNGYLWPGNLRECTALIRQLFAWPPDAWPRILRAAITSGTPERDGGIHRQLKALPVDVKMEMKDLERAYYEKAAHQGGKVREIAELLGEHEATAKRRLKDYGIRRLR